MAVILIIDDDVVGSRPLAALLAGAGHAAHCAADAAEAMAFLRTTRPDLILLDITMPAGGGLDLLRTLRAQPVLKDLPVVVWSAVEDQHTLSEAEHLGALDYFVKLRSDWPQLRERIDALLARLQ